MYDEKTRKITGKYSQKMGRVFGRIFSPNQMTLITLLLGLGSAVLVLYGEFLLAILLLLLSGLSDWIDGAIARATGRITGFGGALDSIVDKLTELAIYLALALYSPILTISSMLAATAMMWSSYANQRVKAIGLAKGRGLLQRKERTFLLIVLFLNLHFFGCTMETCACHANIDVAILYIIAVLSFLTGIQRIALAYRVRK